MTGTKWHRSSARMCAHTDSVLRQIVRAGVALPGGITNGRQITDVAWDLMDLAETVVADDAIWRQLPRNLRIDGMYPQEAREHLLSLVEDSK
jgi:hypothetical protein